MSIGIVNTTSGQVSGLEMDGPYAGITQFRGIPFAAPPVGQLRWKPPADAASWEGVRECTSYAPASIQTFFPSDHLYMFGRPETSEDCLYLNITKGTRPQHSDSLPNTREAVIFILQKIVRLAMRPFPSDDP